MKMIKHLWWLLAVIVWIVVMWPMIGGAIPVNMDTHTIYGVTKYYFNNLLNGIVPLWEPFVVLGRPFYAISICNLFNPITQLVPLLKICGVNYQIAFNIYIVAYFLVMIIGFYFLCRELFSRKWLARLGCVLLLFSSFGVSLFTQLTFLEIVAPCIWFLFFIIRFYRLPSTAHMLGIVYSVMLILSSYLPFYALTMMAVMGSVSLCIIPKQSWALCISVGRWIIGHRLLTLGMMALLAISALPLIAYKLIDVSGDVASPGRHCQYVDHQTCYERTVNEAGGMLYEEIARSGTLGERLDLGYLFSHLHSISYGSDSIFFLPMVVYILALVLMIKRMNAVGVIMAISAFGLWLIGLGGDGPLHRWLYEHVFLMKFFRNLFFFGAFVLVFSICVVLAQLKTWVEERVSKTELLVECVWIGLVIILGSWWLAHQPGIHWSQWVTAILTIAVLVCLRTPLAEQLNGKGFIVWMMLIILQPVIVMASYVKNAREFATVLPFEHTQPVFSWIRPSEPVVNNSRIYQFVPYEDFFYAMSMTDAPAVIGYPQLVAKHTFILSQQVSEEQLKNYAQYKFVVYDDPTLAQGRVIDRPGMGIAIKEFTANHLTITTTFSKPQYLVYNDSYTTRWKVYIDGHPAVLERANQAFKGVWIPEGKHDIRFAYEAPLGGGVYLLTTAVLMMVGLVLIFLLRRSTR